MKSGRHEAIIKIITENEIQTQELLQEKLRKAGYNVTQATVSRDIKSLSLTKMSTGDGRSIYVREPNAAKANQKVKFFSVFSEAVISVDYAQNIVVVKCHVGMGNAACAALDTMNLGGIVGTIAGDDTIFVLMRTNADAARIMEKIDAFIKK